MDIDLEALDDVAQMPSPDDDSEDDEEGTEDGECASLFLH